MSDHGATPKYQHCRPLTAEEYAALKEDIEAHGVLVPVHVDEAGEILSGHHRAKIAGELGISYPRIAHLGLSEDQKHALAVSLEALGRAKDAASKEWSALSLYRDPALRWSVQRISGVLGTPRSTVKGWIEKAEAEEEEAKRAAEAGGQVGGFANLPSGAWPEKVVGEDGKEQPAKKPRRPKAAEPEPATVQPEPEPEVSEPSVTFADVEQQAVEEAAAIMDRRAGAEAMWRLYKPLTHLTTFSPEDVVGPMNADERAVLVRELERALPLLQGIMALVLDTRSLIKAVH